MNVFFAFLLIVSLNSNELDAQSVTNTTTVKADKTVVKEDKASTNTKKQSSSVPVLVKENNEENDFIFYIAPFIGIGAFLTDSIQLANYPYLSGELRMGFKILDRFYALFSVETGLNIKDRSYPALTTITVAPEFYIIDPLSVFAGVGIGILTANTNMASPVLTETRVGFEWKLGLNWQAIRWGEKNQYAFPISIAYTGAKTKWVTCHTIMLSMGFMFFN